MESARLNAHLPAHVRRVQALLAGGAAHQGGLTEDVLDLEVFARIIDAWDDEMRPLTRRQVAERSGLGTRPRPSWPGPARRRWAG